MSHKYVSNKQTLKNTSFLNKLAGTLSGRVGTLDESTDTLTASIEWRSTKSVAKRIKTATGTIAIYDDMPEEEVARLEAEAVEFAGGGPPPTAKPLDARAGKVPPPPPPPPPPAPPPAQQQQQQQQYVVVSSYTTSEGAKVVTGQKMMLVTTSSASKRMLLEDDTELQLLDNSAAKHKMAIRPKKTRPDSRTLAASASASKIQATHTEQEQQPLNEEWLMQSADGKESIWLPKHVVEIDTSAPPPPPPPPPSQKRPAEDDEDGPPMPPGGDALRMMMLQEIREFKTKKKRSSSKLGPSPEDEARSKRSATVRELIETEEELVRDLHFAVENYYQHMDLASTPRDIRDQKELIFSNFNFFPDFHKNVLIEGIKYHAGVPRMIGKTFLRLERDFDQHAEYCSSEPLAQEFLENNAPVREYFEEHSQKIGDDKRIQEHLQLPIQRLNDYQLLIRELVKYGNVLGDDTEELQKALELMQTVPQRATDAKFIASIEGFRGNLYKLGRLIRHDWFSVKESGHHRAHDRYLFLFKARILVTKVKRIAGDRSVFLLKNVIRLPETSLGSLEDPKKLEFSHIEAENHLNYPIVIEARTTEARDAWLEGVQEHVVETASVDDLLFDDEIRIVSEEGDEIDEGRVLASPVPEDCEEFPDDTNLEEFPEDKEAPQGRIIPIVLENDDQVVPDITKEQKKGRAKGDEESSPLPVRKKAKADLLELDEQLQLNQFVSEEVQSRTVESVAHSSATCIEGETTITSASRESTTVVSGVDSSTSTTATSTKATTVVGAQQAERQVESIVQAEPDFAETGLVSTQVSAETVQTDVRLRKQEEEIRQEKEFARRVQQQNFEQQQEISRIEEERKKKEYERLKAEEEGKVREDEEKRRIEEERRRIEEEERIKFEEEKKRKEEEERIRFEEEKRKEEEERIKLEEERKRNEEEERVRLDEEKKIKEDEERIRMAEEKRKGEEKIRLEEEKRKEEEEITRLEEERKRKEEEKRIRVEEKKRKEEEERIKLEEEKRKEEEDRIKLEEETKRKEEEEKMRLEEEKKREEEEERIRLEEEKKRKEEEEERIRLEEEKRKEKEERIRLEEEKKIKEEEERIRLEEERKRKEEEERIKLEEKKRKEEEERIRLEEEKRREEEERIKLEEEKKRKEEEERIKLEEKKRKEEEEKIKLEEKKRKEEEERIKLEEEKKRKEEEERIKLEEEKKRKEEEERNKLKVEKKRKEEEERIKLEEEKKRKEEEERIRLEENKRKEEEERIKLEEKKKRKEEEEKIKLEEEKKRKEEEERIRLEEKKRKEEEEKIRFEEEKKRKEEEERIRLEEKKRKEDERIKLEEKKRKEEEERIKLEEEKKRKEEEERIRLEEEKKRKEEEERVRLEEKKRKEEEERMKLEEEKKRKDEEERIMLEEENKRKEEEEIIKLAEEKRRKEEERIKLEEKKRKVEEERIKLEEEKKRKEEEERIKLEEEKRRKEEEERIRLEEEKKRKEEEERTRLEEEKKREEKDIIKLEEEKKIKEEEERMKLEEEKKRKEEEEKIMLKEKKMKEEEERIKLGEEKKRKEEEERIRLEEEKRKEEEDRIKLEEEKRMEEEERIRLVEEQKRKDEEEKNRLEEESKRKEEEHQLKLEKERKRREKEEEVRLREEQKRKEEEERIKDEKERKKKEKENQLKLEEEEKRKMEEEKIQLEQVRKEEEEIKRKTEEDEKRQLEEEKKRKQEELKKKKEEERIQLENEQRKQEEEEKARLEEKRKKQEEQKRQEEEKRKFEERKKKEDERKKKDDEEKKKIEEELKRIEEKKKKEAERKKEEERKLKEEEELQRKEEARIQLQKEQKRKEMKQQQQKEEEQMRLHEEKVRKERELQQQILDEEMRLQKQQEKKKEEERKLKELERKQREEEEERQLEEERRKKEEERRMRREEEKIKQEEERKRLEDMKRKSDEEKKKKEDEKKKMEEEKRQKEESEKKLEDEKRKQKEADKLKKEEERLEKMRIENEKRKKEEEKRRLEELERQKCEEQQLLKKEEERKKKEKERKRMEEEQKRKDEERVERRRMEEENIRKEEEERKRIEEEFNNKKEEERKKRELERKMQEEERNRKEEERLEKKRKEVEELKKKEEAKRKKEEEKRLREEEEKRQKEEKEKKLREEKDKAKKVQEEQQRLLEEKKRKDEEEKRKKEIEEWNRLEAEMKTKEEQRLRQKEEEKKKKEDERRKKEEERRAKEEERLDNIKKQEELRKKQELEKEKELENEKLEKKKRELEDQRRKEQELKKLEEEKKLEKKKQDELKKQREQKEQEEQLKKEREEKEKKEREQAEMKQKMEKEKSKIKESSEPSTESRLQEPKPSEVASETSSTKKRPIKAEPLAEDQKKAKMSQPQTPTTPGGGPRPVFTKTLLGAVVELPMPRLIQRTSISRSPSSASTASCASVFAQEMKCIQILVQPGECAVFACTVTHPVPYFVTWLKDNKLMDDKLADRVQQTDDGAKHELKILNCRPEDTGIYTAKATDTEQACATCSAQLLVQELTEEERNAKIADKKPFFMVKLRDTTVIETTNLSYVVQAKGDPNPTVKFLKDGKPLKEDDRVKIQQDSKQGHYELLIHHVQKSDAGVYKCTAMNKFGDAECQGTMTVLDVGDLHTPGEGFGENLVRLDASHMPSHYKTFVVATKEQEALESLSGKGSLLKAGEQADFKWFRDGQEFDPLERFNVHYKDEEDTLALVFQNVTPEDAGLYTCVASTSCGKISCSAELTVEGAVKRLNREPQAPEMAEPLSDAAVSAGSSAFLECKVTGYPLPELAWTRNGMEVKVGGRIKQMYEDDDSVSLIIKNIKDSDAGLYRVVAKNELGECESDCKLAIRAGPKIKRMRKEVACNVGSSLDYNVEVEGEPLPEVKWLKDGKELLDSDRIKLVKESDTVFAFKINTMTLADCGTYTVIASNDIGQRSETFQVMCDAPPQITRGLDPETEKKLSNDHTFEVRATGSPTPSARWYKDNKEIMGDDKFRMVKDDAFYMLKIRRLDRKDKGVYKIVLTNATGEAESEGALVIRAPPEFITPLKDACAKEGSKDIKLFVEFQANPKPTIKWTFKDKPIRAETEGFTIKNTDNTSMLVISEALAGFVGNYTVTLGNEYGDSVGKAKFRLHEPPAIVEGLKDVEFLEDNTAKIVVKATGVPVPEIKWTLDGKKYSPDERRVKLKKEGDEVFMIWTDEAKTEDSGLYQATITNCEGTVTTEATVIVNTPPHILSCNFKDGKKVVAMHKFVLEVEATAVPEAAATWFVNNQEIKEAEDVKLNFDGKKYTLERIGCDPEHSGEYTCKLKNKIKEESVSGQVTIYEKESRVRNGLKDVYVKEFSTATLKCQIVGDPVPSVEWLRDGKPIPPSGRFEITEDRSTHWHTLVFKDVAEKDKSVFTVRGKNTHGECETACNLGVLVKPQPGELNSDTVDYGKNVKLSVYIHAYPPPKMVWTLNGKELSDCEHTEYQRDEEAEIYSLYLTSAVLEDIGTYGFTASNEAGEATGNCKLHVHSVVPTVGLEIKSQAICLEDEVTFTLRCCGLPLPVPQWTKKGVVQKGDERTIISTIEADTHIITFKDIRLEDYGMIEVVATSVVGKTSSSCELSQMTLPCEVLEGLDNVTKGAEGEDVTLSVLIRASPRPVVIWTKDGDQLVDSDKVKIFTEKVTYCDMRLSLTLVEATSLESGQYRVKFSNLVNEASTETALVVRPERKAPKIRGKPADAEVTEKGPAMFKCKIAGFPRPDVKWMKDGRQVRPTDVINMGMTADGQFFLEFRHCTPEDAGTYTVVAENEEGKTEAAMNLAVNPPASKPEFLQGLRATKVIRGYPCRMEVKCGGFPKPSISWLKDGQPLEVDGKHIKQIELEDGTVILQIDEATDADAGRYSCVARNADGDNTSSAPLGVLGLIREDGQPDGPAAFTSGLKDTCADEGKTLILPVAVKGGPVPNMKWFKDGKEIKLDDRMFFTYDGDRSFLEIRPCRADDSGVYRCEVEGADGSKDSTECNVTIRRCFEAPSFSQGFNSLQQLPGLDIRLSVRADGVPRPELTWFKDNKPVDMSDVRYKVRKDGESTTLLIRECTYSDSAIYKCIATNKEGSAEHEAAVEVADEIDPNRRAEAPVFLKVIGDQEVFENDNARFKAIVSGKPIPDFQWLKNGHPIIETNRGIPERDIDGIVRLTLKHVCEEDSGSYTLKVWNDYGKASCNGKLTCECISKKVRRPVGDEYQGWDKMKRSGIPIPLPDKPFISALSDRRATISWNPYIAQGPQPPVTYQVEMCESPEGEWFTARTGIRGTSVDITNLAPKCDYKFRIRNENKYGVSEPSPYVATYRNKLEVPPVSYEPKLNASYEPTGDGPYVPEGFSIDRDASGNFFAPPRFLRLLHDTQYGQRSFNSSIKWYAFGYPTPKIRFTFNGKPLETGVKGSRITHTQEATGEIILFIDKITEKDVGEYECYAKNEHGESKQKIMFELAEYPRVTQHLEETHIRSHATGRIMCRIAGYPPCEVQWYKDWAPLKTSFRLRPQFIEPDMYILNFNGAIVRDCGLYSLSAVNVAGVASSSCLVQVEDDDDTFVWTGPGKGRHVQINRRRGQLEDHYDVGDELGRGTQGITYHCVEHFTGRNFAAKSMWGRDRFKVWMHLEHEMMNLSNSCRYITRLYDCYESAKNMVLVMELCAGGELLQTLTQHQYITEYEVAHYIRQLLEGLEYLHDRCIAHLGLNIGDVMLTRPNGTDIKLGDLSLARTIRIAKLQPLDYGMPEYVAPEVALGKGVSYAADMWAVGVITYLLLSGTSPFRGEHDRETLTKVQKGELTFDVEAFANISPEAKDFMAKLLQFKPENRLEVKAAMIHPWLVKSQLQPRDPYKINTDNLRTYYAKYREWYANASCRRWYRRRPLQSAFTHPSKMVYPPGEVYTPPDSPDREMEPMMPPGDYIIPQKDLSYELDPITSDSHYQQGPDTYLLQLRDVDFPVRLRQYMKIAANRSPAYAAQVRENLYDYTSATPQSDEKKSKLNEAPPIETVYSLRSKYDSSTYDYCCSPGEINLDRYIRIPVVHERRRFTDIMDEEIDDERRRTIVDKYSSGFVRQNATTCSLDLPRRVTNEVRSRSHSAVVPVSSTDDSTLAPFLREKPSTSSVGASKSVTLSVLSTGKPAPIIQWFRNDIILAEGGRMQFMSERVNDTTTRATMTLLESRENDVGSYKVVARNQHGQTLHRFRLVQACLPSICDCPEVGGASDTSVLLQWKPPMEDGGSHVLAYHLQIKAKGDIEWRTVDDGVDMERYVVTNLTPDSLYQFRLAARNSLGWGEFSIGTPAIRTGPSGCPKLLVPPGLAVEDHKTGVAAKQQKDVALDYSKEDEPVTIKTGEGADLQVRKYKVVDELSRGRFSTVGRCVRSDDHRLFAVKVLATANRDEQVRLELDLLRSLRHQRLALLHEAYQLQEATVLVQELLSGVDIVTYLSQRHAYSEQIVAVLLTQVLDGLSYLQWRGVCHLDLQPDNLVLSSTRFPSVKLVDFGSARKVEQTGTAVPVNGLTEYIAPEVLFDGKAYPNTDIWSLGVIAYVLLSGVSPFRGDTEEDLKANIQCVRYRFEWLPTTTTQEANRFLMLIFKRDPSKRPTVDECLEHRWLNETDFMVKKRERASIISNRIRDYSQQYHGQMSKSVTTNKLLLNFAGLKQ